MTKSVYSRKYWNRKPDLIRKHPLYCAVMHEGVTQGKQENICEFTNTVVLDQNQGCA